MSTFRGYKTFTGKGVPGIPRSYVISENKAKIVDFAIKLGRPLLVEGEAGCGKTLLAQAIADELELKKPIVIPIRSTSRANDLLYRFDALRRLQDAQIEEKRKEAAWTHNYIELEPLGEAIMEGRSCVVLIDEVDKGDLDFPNDLLHVLSEFEFRIDEIPAVESEQAKKDKKFGHHVTGGDGARPIVIFTSNREKPLPMPFLRRCIYLELKFPETTEELEEIVEVNLRNRFKEREPGYEALETISRQIITKSVASFLKIRAKATENNAYKKPATAELIDWVHALHWEQERESEIDGLVPPYWELLFSTARDIEANVEFAKEKRTSEVAEDKKGNNT